MEDKILDMALNPRHSIRVSKGLFIDGRLMDIGYNKIVYRDVCIDLDTFTVTRGGVEIKLAPKPFYVFTLLVFSYPMYVEKETIIELIWDNEYYVSGNNIESVVSTLRKKIDGPFQEKYIQSSYTGRYSIQ